MELRNSNLRADIHAGVPLSLDLGGGIRRKPGFYAMDLLPLDGIDIVADFNEPFDLLPDNCVKAIFSNHVLEHVKNLDGLLREIHRISRSGSRIEIVVPHFSNPYYYSDPTHVRFFGLYSMNYFVDKEKQKGSRKVPAFYTDLRFDIELISIEFFSTSGFDRMLSRILMKLVNRNFSAQDFYERWLSGLIRARQIRFIMTPEK